MDSTTLLGLIAGALTTVSFFPQVIRTIRTRDTRSLSLGMYAIFVVGVALWIVYGVLLGKAPVIIANALTLVLSLIVLVCKLRWG
jgi:MtN3 and saliva related transmembrane protein